MLFLNSCDWLIKAEMCIFLCILFLLSNSDIRNSSCQDMAEYFNLSFSMISLFQESCESCPPGEPRTGGSGATSESQCGEFCPFRKHNGEKRFVAYVDEKEISQNFGGLFFFFFWQNFSWTENSYDVVGLFVFCSFLSKYSSGANCIIFAYLSFQCQMKLNRKRLRWLWPIESTTTICLTPLQNNSGQPAIPSQTR